MTQTTHQELANRLRAAYTAGAVPPLRDGLDPTDAAGAYAVQAINTRFWQSQGRRMVGGQEDMIVDVALDLVKQQEAVQG